MDVAQGGERVEPQAAGIVLSRTMEGVMGRDRALLWGNCIVAAPKSIPAVTHEYFPWGMLPACRRLGWVLDGRLEACPTGVLM